MNKMKEMGKKNGMRIGELAKKASVTPRTIRFYVQEGLLPQPLYSQRNIAYYAEDFVEKIRAIKQAQKERYLPLVVIRRILAKNDYDYRVLNAGQQDDKSDELTFSSEVIQVQNQIAEDIPQEILNELTRQQWGRYISKDNEEVSFIQDSVLLNFLSALNRAGASWDEVIKSLKELQRIIEEAVEVEFQTLIALLMRNPREGFSQAFDQVMQMEEEAVGNFNRAITRKQLKKIAGRFKQYMDNSYLASADEGFAVQTDEIHPELVRLEKRLPAGEIDVRILNDLSIGYSCAGELDLAVRYLDQVLKVFPENLETKVRWFWYKRFSGRPAESLRLKQQLIQLVEDNPDYAFARAFLAIWHFMGVLAQDDHGRILQEMNLSIEQLDRAGKGQCTDLHEWMVVQYFKGRILTAIYTHGEYMAKGIDAFHGILKEKQALDKLYSNRMPFYSKWLWPNLYFFLGNAYLRSGHYDDALKVFKKGEKYNMMPPYKERLQQCMETIKMKGKEPPEAQFDCR